ncbi:MAG: hypothetical protein FJW63_04090 [Actinobacteria bacterium]|nr:hypothetical protein [Actinomycetota bacterium]
MNARERVRTTLSHKEPDRVPVDNNPVLSGMHEIAYKNLLKYLNLEDEIRICDPVQRLAQVKEEVMNILGVDIRYIFPKYPTNYKYLENPDGTFKDEFGTVYKKVGYYADIKIPILRGKSFNEIKAYKFPDPQDKSRFIGLEEKSKELYKNTEFSLWSGYGPSIMYMAWCLRGIEDFMMDIYSEPKIAKYLMDKAVDWGLKFSESLYNEIGQVIDVFWVGDDLGVQNGPLISPIYFRKELMPRFKKIIGFIKSKTKAKCAFHSCGSIYCVLNDLINIGVDVIHPVQTNAKDNYTDRLKAEFGDRIVFHGGTNNQGVFHKDIHTLTMDTLMRIKDLAPGGGYIFSSGHNIQANMPPENI